MHTCFRRCRRRHRRRRPLVAPRSRGPPSLALALRRHRLQYRRRYRRARRLRLGAFLRPRRRLHRRRRPRRFRILPTLRRPPRIGRRRRLFPRSCRLLGGLCQPALQPRRLAARRLVQGRVEGRLCRPRLLSLHPRRLHLCLRQRGLGQAHHLPEARTEPCRLRPRRLVPCLHLCTQRRPLPLTRDAERHQLRLHRACLRLRSRSSSPCCLGQLSRFGSLGDLALQGCHRSLGHLRLHRLANGGCSCSRLSRCHLGLSYRHRCHIPYRGSTARRQRCKGSLHLVLHRASSEKRGKGLGLLLSRRCSAS